MQSTIAGLESQASRRLWRGSRLRPKARRVRHETDAELARPAEDDHKTALAAADWLTGLLVQGEFDLGNVLLPDGEIVDVAAKAGSLAEVLAKSEIGLRAGVLEEIGRFRKCVEWHMLAWRSSSFAWP